MHWLQWPDSKLGSRGSRIAPTQTPSEPQPRSEQAQSCQLQFPKIASTVLFDTSHRSRLALTRGSYKLKAPSKKPARGYRRERAESVASEVAEVAEKIKRVNLDLEDLSSRCGRNLCKRSSWRSRLITSCWPAPGKAANGSCREGAPECRGCAGPMLRYRGGSEFPMGRDTTFKFRLFVAGDRQTPQRRLSTVPRLPGRTCRIGTRLKSWTCSGGRSAR
jgi:hypothetical protein